MQKQGKVSPQRWRLLRDKNADYSREHDSYAYEKLLFLVSSMVMEIGEKGKGGVQGDVQLLKCSSWVLSALRSVNGLEFKKSKKSSHCELFFVCCLSASHPVVEFAIAEMACVSSNVRRTFHVPSGVRVQRSISERDVSHPWSWTRAHRADVHFNKHLHDLFQVSCGVCFQWFVPERSPSYPWLEWALFFICDSQEDIREFLAYGIKERL